MMSFGKAYRINALFKKRTQLLEMQLADNLKALTLFITINIITRLRYRLKERSWRYGHNKK